MLFEAEEDYAYYLDALEKYSRDLHVTVCAYCLMEDHVHLLMYDPEQRIPTLMKKLGVRYSYYFNRKYVRIGPVFGDRYRSEAVEDNRYLLSVYRYILREPEKAGIGKASE
ncbi:MAG: transposase [Clostridia bacterium]|nr:transposase [Clostridia bacterium]